MPTIISREKMVKEKAERLADGLNAFAETEEVSLRLKKELQKRQLQFIEEKTEMGTWFFPKS